MNRLLRWLIYSLPPLALIAVAVYFYHWLAETDDNDIVEQDYLIVYASADLQPPIKEISDFFMRRTGVRVDVTYGSAGELLERLLQGETADIFLADDIFFIREAERAGLVEGQVYPVARLVPVIMFNTRRSTSIERVEDLLAAEIRLGRVEERVSALGRITPLLLGRTAAQEEALDRAVIVRPSSRALARTVESGVVDAAIVWRSSALQHPHNTAVIEIPARLDALAEASIVMLKNTRMPEDAEEFIAFIDMAAGRQSLDKYHYERVVP